MVFSECTSKYKITFQLNENLSHEDVKDEAEIKEAFMEFYKLLDDYEIIDKNSYQYINEWFQEKINTKEKI